jgi:hypothetical protein
MMRSGRAWFAFVLALGACALTNRSVAQEAVAQEGAALNSETKSEPAAAAAAAAADTSTVAPAASPEPASASTAGAADSTTTHKVDLERIRYLLAEARARGAADAQAQSIAREGKPLVHGDAGAAFAIGLSVDAVFYSDPGYDLFAEDDVTPRLGVWIAYDVLALGERAFLATELGFGTESEEQDDLFQQGVTSSLDSQTLYAALSLRYVLLPWLQPHARLAAGASFVSMEIAQNDEDDGVSPLISLGAGVMLKTPTRFFENAKGEFASVGVGVLVEGGYALRGSLDFELSQSSGSHAIPLTSSDLGTLDLSGPFVRTSLVVRF